jgi:outer membrane murein-binding lipoprotein Lpp
MQRLGISLIGCVTVFHAGCGGDARVDLTAADTLEATAAQLERGLQEYQADVAAADDAKEAQIVSAFAARLRKDAADDVQVERHTREFSAALAKIRQDRQVADQRLHAGQDNVAAVNEVARGLRKLAIESLTLQDEVRRYFTQLLETRRAAQAAAKPKGGNQEGAK